MVKIEFLGPINKADIELDISNLKQLSEKLNQDESLKDWLLNSAVAVNDQIVQDLDVSLKNGDRVSILPPVCGG